MAFSFISIHINLEIPSILNQQLPIYGYLISYTCDCAAPL